ncbi:pancreatic secretory granule membrane major glycoprotein GP2 isoform X2 [Nematostella vectensis]|uniref:pancreatic secretory granule membrane major glycoprotein GP2 isoform X2 n=1 Tax=Nematostella vectensis TaxID=45351 RepID=UPI0020775B87|nr:pancreatic secretory granule membrane major glycoprotein GP2 isoform X2 [Nematostella vectensis]
MHSVLDEYTMCTTYGTLKQDTRGDLPLYSPNAAEGVADSTYDVTRWYALMDFKGHPLKISPLGGRCLAQHSIWMDGQHPGISDGVVERTLCLSKNGNRCYTKLQAHIRRCHGHYVYRFDKANVTMETKTNMCSVRDISDERPIVYTPHAPRDTALLGHVIKKFSDVTDKTQCFVYCLLRAHCFSFNYSKRFYVCELNSQTAQNIPDLLQKRQGFQYYEKKVIDSREIMI